jgi:hypothetical protein
VDAAGLAMWLFFLNGFVFFRPLDQDDWTTFICVPLLCQAAFLGYGLRPGHPWWRWVLKGLAGQALATAILYLVFVRLNMDLSGRQILKLSISYLPWLLLSRVAYLVCRRILPLAPLECFRLYLVAGVGFFLFGVRYLSSADVGSGDSYWYCIMLGDFVKQWRAGIFPVFVGQSEYAFNGAVSPLRLAPGLQHLAGIVDLLTGQCLPFFTLQNLTLTFSGLAGGFSAYFCCAAILPKQRWTALALAALYLACPGVLSLGYRGDLFMSMTTLPFVPVVGYGLWRTLRDDEHTSIAWTVLPVAAAWYCHPPIALWLTFLAVLAHVAIGWRRWRDPRLYAWWGRGAMLFLLAAGYVFVSVITLHLPSESASVDLILQSVRSSFPGMLLPVDVVPGPLTCYQLGWTLWSFLLLATIGGIFRSRRSEGVLLLGAGYLLLLLIPIPGLNPFLWHALPKTVCDITFLWPMQRFYPIVAGLVVVAAAGVWAKLGSPGFIRKAAGFALLSAGLAWSCREAITIVLHDYFERGPAPAPPPDPSLDADNIVLTRYAFNSFRAAPPYYSHGYIDPYLENRILAPDQRKVLASNVEAVEPSEGAAQIPLTATYDGDRVSVLSPGFALAPGIRYAIRFVPSTQPPSGTLLILGKSVGRQYLMPDSGLGMNRHGSDKGFGLTPTSRNFFPIWTMQPKPETIGFRYIYDAVPTQPVPANFARLYLQTYTIDRLPVKVSAWMPYRATTTVAVAGAWLETPRMYIPGYAATVNGRKTKVSPSPNGQVAVLLQPGENDVVLRYPGPWILRLSYWIALLTWATVGGILIRRAVLRWRAGGGGSRSKFPSQPSPAH